MKIEYNLNRPLNISVLYNVFYFVVVGWIGLSEKDG